MLPEGEEGSAATERIPAHRATVQGLGNRKNQVFNDIVSAGVEPFEGSVRFLEAALARGLKVAVVSSSRNAPAVLKAAGLNGHFAVVVDGVVAAAEGLPGKPSPATYEYAAQLLGLPSEECVVVEDAVSGVQAGQRGQLPLRDRRRPGRRPADPARRRGHPRGQRPRGTPLASLRPGKHPTTHHPDQHHAKRIPTPWLSSPRTAHGSPTTPGSSWKPSTSPATPAPWKPSFSLGNGHLGIRGAHWAAADAELPGSFINGFHEIWDIKHAENAFGFARTGQRILYIPDANNFTVIIDGETL